MRSEKAAAEREGQEKKWKRPKSFRDCILTELSNTNFEDEKLNKSAGEAPFSGDRWTLYNFDRAEVAQLFSSHGISS